MKVRERHLQDEVEERTWVSENELRIVVTCSALFASVICLL